MVLAHEPAGLTQNVACLEQGRGDDSASDAPYFSTLLSWSFPVGALGVFRTRVQEIGYSAECWRTTKYGQAKQSKRLSLTEAKKIATIDKINS